MNGDVKDLGSAKSPEDRDDVVVTVVPTNLSNMLDQGTPRRAYTGTDSPPRQKSSAKTINEEDEFDDEDETEEERQQRLVIEQEKEKIRRRNALKAAATGKIEVEKPPFSLLSFSQSIYRSVTSSYVASKKAYEQAVELASTLYEETIASIKIYPDYPHGPNCFCGCRKYL